MSGVEGLVAVLGSAGLMALAWLRTDHLVPAHPWWTFPGDHHIYLYMAEHPVGDLHLAPWGWRILEPAIVRVLPGSPLAGFQIVSVASLTVAATCVYLICRELGFDRWLAACGLLLFASLSFATKYLMFDFWLTDPLAFAAVALAVLFAVQDRIVPFAICLAAGVLAKESVLFAAPLIYTFHATRPIDVPALRRAILAIAPAVLLLVAVRIAIPAWNGQPYAAALPAPIAANARTVPDYSALAIVRDTMSGRDLWGTLVATVSSFGLLVGLLPFLGGPQARRLALRTSPFLLLVLLQLVFARNTQRLVVLAFPVVVPLAVDGLATLRRRGASDASLLGTCAVFVGLQLLDPAEIAPAALIQLAALAACALWMWRELRPAAEQMVPR